MHSEERYCSQESIIEKIQRLMGWCPNARALRVSPVPSHDPVQVPASGGSGMPALSFGRVNRYRTRAFAFALCMTGVGFSLFATANGDRLAMLGIGLLLATLLWVSDAVNYWRLFHDVERNGIADEKDWKEISVVRILPIIGVALVLGFAGAVLVGLVPGLTMLMVNGFLAGFAAIGWYHLATILAWESRSGIALFSDGTRIYRRETQ